jgi:hypothetical protein
MIIMRPPRFDENWFFRICSLSLIFQYIIALARC